jgi:formate--tetrahydrofolate ligase
VLVATIRALKMHGGVAKDDLKKENLEALRKGLSNLQRHVSNVQKYGVPVVVSINRFSADTQAEIDLVKSACGELGVEAFMADHWAAGGAGAADIARAVVKLYDMPLWEKMRTIAREIYGASDISAEKSVKDQIAGLQKDGFGHFPICVAKTQYSFSTDANAKGAPSGHVIPIREVRVSAGAEFLVFICGEIMTMPGLPKVPAANSIEVNAEGRIVGLF